MLNHKPVSLRDTSQFVIEFPNKTEALNSTAIYSTDLSLAI
jgi:hypothetical protein